MTRDFFFSPNHLIMSDPGPIPSRWLRCPRKSEELIAGKFLALKTPLDQRYDSQVPPQFLFYPSMLFSAMKSYKVKIGLWIDLSNTSRFYDKRLVEEAQEGGCRYASEHFGRRGASQVLTPRRWPYTRPC